MAETNDNQNAYRLRELSEGLDKLAELVRELSQDSLAPVSAISAVWAEAPIILRLKFVRDVLPEKSELQPLLRQASALEELRQKGSELDTWVERYPALFADAITLLNYDTALTDLLMNNQDEQAITLALSTLAEAKETLDRELSSFGLQFILVTPGEAIGPEHEVVGEEASSFSKGTVARLTREGFRKKGQLCLPAQVMRSSGPLNTQYPMPNIDTTQPSPQPSPNSLVPGSLRAEERGSSGRGWERGQCPSPVGSAGEAKTPNTQYPIPNTDSELSITDDPAPSTSFLTPNTEHRTPSVSDPEWLRILIQRTHGCALEPVNEVVLKLQELVSAASSNRANTQAGPPVDFVQLLESITPLVSMRYADGLTGIGEVWGKPLLEARDPILEWLKETLSIDPISPNRGDKYNPLLMEEVETRRTVHANEIETVARIERIGLMRDGLPVIKAEVVRYVAGRE